MAVKQLKSREEALDEIARLVEEAGDAKFLVAVWDIRDDHVNYKGKVAWDFPRADFLAAASFLLEDMRNEMAEPAEEEVTPLQFAKFLQDRRQGLNGKGRSGDQTEEGGEGA